MRRQRIFFEGLALVDGHFSGVGQYLLGILRAIDEIIDNEKYRENAIPAVKVVIPHDTVARFASFEFRNIGQRSLPLSLGRLTSLWSRGKMFPIDLWCGKGVYIFPRFVGMPLAFSKSATVIYDLSFELYPRYSEDRNALFLSRGVKRTLETTNKVITISHNARKEILDFYGLSADQVVVATPAIDGRHFYRRSQREIDDVKRKYKIEGEYILALSNLEPRKNLEGLVDAYCDLPAVVREDMGLLLVGVNGWKFEALFEKVVAKVEEGFNIMRPSHFVADQDRPAVISGAKLLVYPSHYEGFGMPPLEALACGVPVITANNSSLPEVVGDLGRMVDSSDIAGIASAIEQELEIAAKDPRDIRVAGPQRARQFSWTKSARIFLEVAEELQR